MRTTSAQYPSKAGLLAISAIASAAALAAAACGSTSGAAAPAASSASPAHHAMTHHAAAASATFGPDCGMVPASGMGSLHGMMTDPIVTAASHNPLLTTLAADVKAAGLTAALNSMGSITIFAPSNRAFSKLPHAMMTGMMHNASELAKILKYHVVSGHVTTARLASGKPLTTLQGSTLQPAKMGAGYEVNHASVICGNIQTANATVYIINKVLTPMH
jgi:uncharacterized surface protein with fasciclin (FAS1) repeats